MRLLNIRTGQLQEFLGADVPEYAILSHTWGQEEVLFEDLSPPTREHPNYKKKAGYAKIKGCCRRAGRDGYEYVWVDTCCINKGSSAELSESINSMFKWYQSSAVCYVYLADVPAGDDPFAAGSAFRRSRWFTRGWTLQELIAPRGLIFFDAAWTPVFADDRDHDQAGDQSAAERRAASGVSLSSSSTTSSRLYLAKLKLLEEITEIAADVLSGEDPYTRTPVGLRLSWASKRNTTREEDRAYCLLGLLEVNMPLLYGESDNAFVRLQEEILKTSNDLSVLAWGYGLTWHEIRQITENRPQRILASSPSLFRCFKQMDWYQGSLLSVSRSHSTLTNHGLHIEMSLLCLDRERRTYLGIVNQMWEPQFPNRGYIAIPLTQQEDEDVFARANGSTPFKLLLPMITLRRRRKWKRIYIQEADGQGEKKRHWTKDVVSLLGGSLFGMLGLLGIRPGLVRIVAGIPHINAVQLFKAGYTVHSVYPVPWIHPQFRDLDYADLIHGRLTPLRVLIFSKPGCNSFALQLKATTSSSRVRDTRRRGDGQARETRIEEQLHTTALLAHADTSRLAIEYFVAEFVSGAPKGQERPQKLDWKSSISIRDSDQGSASRGRVSAVCEDGDCMLVLNAGRALRSRRRPTRPRSRSKEEVANRISFDVTETQPKG